MEQNTNIPKEMKNQIFKSINARADKFSLYVLITYGLLGIALSFVYATQLVAFGVGGLCILAYFVTKLLLPNRTLHHYVFSGALAIFTAQFIYQMHGMFEMHFFVFVGSTLLITYQNWKLQLPLILIVVIHHATFAYLQYAGDKEIYFTQLAYMDLATFMVHGLLAAIIVAICGWWSFEMEKRTVNEFEKNMTFQSQMTSIKENILFAEEISKGNLSFDSGSKGKEDELGNALLAMQRSLVVSTKREQQEKYITIGINTISEILRNHSNNIDALANELIKGIVKYMGLNQGGLFLIEGEEDKNLKLVACYAFERRKFLQKRIGLGEGLVGQCFLEKDIIYMKDVPPDYIRITPGLGDAPPSNILLVPVKTQDQIIGVLELASLYEIDQNKIDFVTKACEGIASAVISTQVTQRVQFLLTDAQQQAEEMRSQEEEMRQNMEELSATQEEMQRKEQEYIARIERLESALNSKTAS